MAGKQTIDESSKTTDAVPSLSGYILTEAERQKLQARASMFSARRESAIGWIDETLSALQRAERRK